MTISNRSLLWMAAASAVLSAATFWWWSRLIASDFATCVATAAPTGVDCRHGVALFAAVALAGLCILLSSTVAIRGLRGSFASRRAA